MTSGDIDRILTDMTIEREAKKVKEMQRFSVLEETLEYEKRFRISRQKKRTVTDLFGNIRKVETRFSLRVVDLKNIRTKTIIEKL